MLRAAQVVVDEHLARPVLVGRPEAIAARIGSSACGIPPGRDVEVAGFDDEAIVGPASRRTTGSAAGGGWSATSRPPRCAATAR